MRVKWYLIQPILSCHISLYKISLYKNLWLYHYSYFTPSSSPSPSPNHPFFLFPQYKWVRSQPLSKRGEVRINQSIRFVPNNVVNDAWIILTDKVITFRWGKYKMNDEDKSRCVDKSWRHKKKFKFKQD